MWESGAVSKYPGGESAPVEGSKFRVVLSFDVVKSISAGEGATAAMVAQIPRNALLREVVKSGHFS